jgi:hypothetical protein
VALSWLHEYVLGVTIVNFNGNSTFYSAALQIKPDDGRLLPFIEGVTFTPFGSVAVSWEVANSVGSLSADVPGAVDVIFALPPSCPTRTLVATKISGDIISQTPTQVVVRGAGLYTFTC